MAAMNVCIHQLSKLIMKEGMEVKEAIVILVLFLTVVFQIYIKVILFNIKDF